MQCWQAWGYRIDLLLGPTAAPFLVAASREPKTPWSWRATAITVGMLVAFLGASAAAQGAFPEASFSTPVSHGPSPGSLEIERVSDESRLPTSGHTRSAPTAMRNVSACSQPGFGAPPTGVSWRTRCDGHAGTSDACRWHHRCRVVERGIPRPGTNSVREFSRLMRVLIADDEDLMRAGLIELLTADPEIAIIGEASSGHEAVELARRLAPDVVLMDVRMPDLDGIAATRELSRVAPNAKVLILTTFDQDDYVFGALRAGASGFLVKRTRPEDLIAAVRTIASGDSLLSPSVTRRVIDRMAQQPTPELSHQARLDDLTPREREVLELIARGLSNREIAAALVVEKSTIRTHVRRILMKLDLRDRVQAVIFAYETGVNRPGVRARSR